MSILREQRRAWGRKILQWGRFLKARWIGKPGIPTPERLPRKILIIRPYFLGDILLCLPVAQTLKRQDSTVSISWLVNEPWQDLLKHHPAVDEVLTFSMTQMQGWKGFREWFRVTQLLRKKSFDLVINLSWDRSSSLWALFSRAPMTLGLEEYGRPRLLSLTYTETVLNPERSQDARHMAEFYFEPLKLLGFKMNGESPRVQAHAADLEMVDLQLRETLGDAGGFILIHPGGRLSHKRWPSERFGDFLNRYSAGYGESMVLVCGPGEESWVADLARALPDGKGLFWPTPTLGEFMALASRSRLFLGNDSGPAHLAAACGCKVLALFGNDPTRWRPLGKESRVLYQKGGLKSLSVESVIQEVNTQLGFANEKASTGGPNA